MTRRHTRAEIEAILDRRDREGLTYEELAKQTGVAKSTLNWWSWRRRREGREGRGRQSQRRFAEVVTVSDDRIRGRAIELTTSSGLSVWVPPDFDEETLARVLALLDRC